MPNGRAVGLEHGSVDEGPCTQNPRGCVAFLCCSRNCVSFVRDLGTLRQGSVQGTKTGVYWASQHRKREGGAEQLNEQEFTIFLEAQIVYGTNACPTTTAAGFPDSHS